MSYTSPIATLRRLFEVLSDPRLQEEVERMAQSEETVAPDTNASATSSMSQALRQMGLIRQLPDNLLPGQANDPYYP